MPRNPLHNTPKKKSLCVKPEQCQQNHKNIKKTKARPPSPSPPPPRPGHTMGDGGRKSKPAAGSDGTGNMRQASGNAHNHMCDTYRTSKTRRKPTSLTTTTTERQRTALRPSVPQSPPRRRNRPRHVSVKTPRVRFPHQTNVPRPIARDEWFDRPVSTSTLVQASHKSKDLLLDEIRWLWVMRNACRKHSNTTTTTTTTGATSEK